MIDENGYRLNVGIILISPEKYLFWAKRIGQDAWQFPQGGIQHDESPETAMYRELREEIGLLPEDVSIISSSQNWIHYQLPKNLIRQNHLPLCIGQKQKWFLLALRCDERKIQLNHASLPEFDSWCWVDVKTPIKDVIFFKREAYKQALAEFESFFS